MLQVGGARGELFTTQDVEAHVSRQWGPALKTVIKDARSGRVLNRGAEAGAPPRPLPKVSTLLIRRTYAAGRGGKYVRALFVSSDVKSLRKVGWSGGRGELWPEARMLIGRGTTPLVILTALESAGHLRGDAMGCRVTGVVSGRYLDREEDVFDAVGDEALLMVDDWPGSPLALAFWTVAVEVKSLAVHEPLYFHLWAPCAQVVALVRWNFEIRGGKRDTPLYVFFGTELLPEGGEAGKQPFDSLPCVQAAVKGVLAGSGGAVRSTVIELSTPFSIIITSS